MVLSDGSVVVCSQDNNSDLFHAIPWSYGTLGFLASVEIDIIPAKRFIQLNYKPTYSQSEMIEVIKDLGSLDEVFRFSFTKCKQITFLSIVHSRPSKKNAGTQKITNLSNVWCIVRTKEL